MRPSSSSESSPSNPFRLRRSEVARNPYLWKAMSTISAHRTKNAHSRTPRRSFCRPQNYTIQMEERTPEKILLFVADTAHNLSGISRPTIIPCAYARVAFTIPTLTHHIRNIASTINVPALNGSASKRYVCDNERKPKSN